MAMIKDKPRPKGPSMQDMSNLWRPQFDSLMGPGGELREGFGSGFGSSGMDEQTKMATAAPGTSAWEQMMTKKQGTEEAGQRDLAQRQGAQAGSQAWNQMAMRGGAGAGSRERAAIAGQQQMGQNLQNVARGGTEARQDIGLGAEKMRRDMLGDVAGREARGRFSDQAIKVGDVASQRGFDMTKFTERMAGEAAERQAKAIENSGKA